MRTMIAPVLLVIAMAGCGPAGKDGPMNSITTDTKTTPPVGQITLTSSAFADGQPIPAKYGCDQNGSSPPLSWTGLPNGTKSIAITIDDPDAKKGPDGTFRHWAAYDITPTTTGLPEGAGKPGNPAFKQSLNDGRKPGYTPMCPPHGDPEHHYHFRLFALDVPVLDVSENAKVTDVESAAAGHSIGQGELVGTFVRN